MYVGVHVKYPLFLSDFNETWSVQWEPSCSMQTDGQTDMTKLTVVFRNFVNAPKNDSALETLWTSQRQWPVDSVG
jgi:hypothetical protein